MQHYLDVGWTEDHFHAYYNAFLHESHFLRLDALKQEAEELWCDVEANLQAYLRYEDRWIEPYRLPGDDLPRLPPVDAPDQKARRYRWIRITQRQLRWMKRGGPFRGIRGVLMPVYGRTPTPVPVEEDEAQEYSDMIDALIERSLGST